MLDRSITTVEPPLMATSLQWPGFFIPTMRQSIHCTLIETSLKRPPLYVQRPPPLLQQLPPQWRIQGEGRREDPDPPIRP